MGKLFDLAADNNINLNNESKNSRITTIILKFHNNKIKKKQKIDFLIELLINVHSYAR